MTETLQLDTHLPLFEPRSRHAILLNNHDKIKNYSQTNVFRGGNNRVYGLEAILSGGFAEGPNKFGKPLSEYLSVVFQNVLLLHQKYRQGIPYDSVTRILPKTEMRQKLDEELERISSVSSDDMLTFVYITSHGNSGNFSIDNKKRTSHQDLLEKLDKIKGKKVIVALACYSGSFLDVWKESSNKEDYIIVTSDNKEKSTREGENVLHGLLMDNIKYAAKMSDLKLPISLLNEHHPKIVGAYDVIL